MWWTRCSRRLALRRPFVEDRAAEQADAVGQRARMLDAFLADRQAFVEAGEIERIARSPCRRAARRRRIRRPAARPRRGARRTARAARPARRGRSPRSRRRQGDGPKRAHGAGHRASAARRGKLARRGAAPSKWPPFQSMRSGGRVVEGARLESEYTAKPYRGFESLPLRQLFPETLRPLGTSGRRRSCNSACRSAAGRRRRRARDARRSGCNGLRCAECRSCNPWSCRPRRGSAR